MLSATATATSGAAATRSHAGGGYACPHCAGPLRRIPRRWVDRLLGVLVLLRTRRYGCRRCPWSGNLHDVKTVGALPSGPGSSYRRRGRSYRL